MTARCTFVLAIAVWVLAGWVGFVGARATVSDGGQPVARDRDRPVGERGTANGEALAPRKRTVYAGPVDSGMLDRAIAWWNRPGARLVLARATKEDADIAISEFRSFSGDAVGATVTPASCPANLAGRGSPSSGEAIAAKSR